MLTTEGLQVVFAAVAIISGFVNFVIMVQIKAAVSAMKAEMETARRIDSAAVMVGDSAVREWVDTHFERRKLS